MKFSNISIPSFRSFWELSKCLFHQLHRFGDRKINPTFRPNSSCFFPINQLPAWGVNDFWQKKICDYFSPFWFCTLQFWPSVRSIWDTPGQNQLKNGLFLSKIRFKKKCWSKSSYFSRVFLKWTSFCFSSFALGVKVIQTFVICDEF